MEIILGALAFLVLVLTILQGWQMVQKRKNNNTNNPGLADKKLDEVITILNRMEQRTNDIWERINK